VSNFQTNIVRFDKPKEFDFFRMLAGELLNPLISNKMDKRKLGLLEKNKVKA
jgi:hypothetical protein